MDVRSVEADGCITLALRRIVQRHTTAPVTANRLQAAATTLGVMRASAPASASPLRDGYRDVGPAGSRGPAAAYERMAASAIARLPPHLSGWRVLDLGAGTGGVSRCISDVGGWPVALDPAHGMLRQALQ